MSKRNQASRDHNSRASKEVINLNDVRTARNVFKKKKDVRIIPRNVRQEELVDYLNNDEKRVIFAVGPAGTGKTLLSTLKAIKALQIGAVEKIIVTRPTVGADEDLGFLPGTLIEKMAPWVRPIMDVFKDFYTAEEIEAMLEEGILEFAPFAFMRGRTFKNAFIIADECQNSTIPQLRMLLTRIGEGSRMVVTGDLEQSDIGRDNGLSDFLSRFYDSDRISTCFFEHKHIERDPVVSEILEIYGE